MERLTKPELINGFLGCYPKNDSGLPELIIRSNPYRKIVEKLKEYEDLEEQGKLIKLPCAIGDTIYVIAECKHVSKQLDGTIYGSDGSPGTATGYYCPYESDCPFDGDDFEDCEKYKSQEAVFKDYVNQISVYEDGRVHIFTENCAVLGIFGQDVFLTRKEAEAALRVVV